MSDYLSNISFAIDYPDYFQKYGKRAQDHTQLDNIQEEIIQTNDISASCFLAYEFEYHTFKMQKVVLNSKSLKHILFFAQFIENADLKALQKAIINSSSKSRLKYLIQFAYSIPSVDKKKIERIIIEEIENDPKQVRFAYQFLQYLNPINPARFIKIILENGTPAQWFYLATLATSRKEVALIEKKLMKAGSFRFVRKMAESIKLANIEKLEQWVLDSGNIKEIKAFGRAIGQSRSRHLSILF